MAAASAELSSYADQPDLCGQFLAAARSGALFREHQPDHLTASAVVLDAARTHVLLVLHSKVGLWLQPGGHCEPGDVSLSQAALREAREETGVTDLALVGRLPVHLDRHWAPCGARHHLDVRFLATAAVGAATAVSEESDDVRSWPVDALPAQAGTDLPALLAAARGRCERG